MKATLAILVLALPVPAIAQASGIPCTCRLDGRDMPEGSIACLRNGGGEYLARCGKVLNNSAWIRLEAGCPTG